MPTTANYEPFKSMAELLSLVERIINAFVISRFFVLVDEPMLRAVEPIGEFYQLLLALPADLHNDLCGLAIVSQQGRDSSSTESLLESLTEYDIPTNILVIHLRRQLSFASNSATKDWYNLPSPGFADWERGLCQDETAV